MYVISPINTKGGSGKTTTCLILATQLASAGYNVVVIDTDKAKNITDWQRIRLESNKAPVFNLVTETEHENLTKTIDKLENDGEVDFCIIDTEGSADELQGIVLSRTDLVIISLTPSEMDASQSRQVLLMINGTEKAIGRKIPFIFSFCRTNAAILLTEQRLIQQDLDEAGLPRLNCTIVERSAYRQVFRTGELIEELSLKREQKSKAIANAKRYTIEIIEHLQELEG